MKLEAQRQQLLKPLQHIINVVERRQTLPILSHVLMCVRAGAPVTFTVTDLDVELSASTECISDIDGDITLPAFRFRDILRALPEENKVTLSLEKEKVIVQCGRSRFTLVTLPAIDFPTLRDRTTEGASTDAQVEIRLPQSVLRHLIERVHFAMAQQDVRHYLNGLLLEVSPGLLRVVATDGHRLARHEVTAEVNVESVQQIILPRKGVLELLRLLSDNDDEVVLTLNPHHLHATIGNIRCVAKLLEGKFPDYERVIPKSAERVVIVDKALLRSALTRTALVLNNKAHGILVQLSTNMLRTQAKNIDQEEAEEEVVVAFDGEPIEIGFNGSYLLDALGAITGEKARLSFAESGNSCLIEEINSDASKHVIMPMRL